jgi:hypothetical protein
VPRADEEGLHLGGGGAGMRAVLGDERDVVAVDHEVAGARHAHQPGDRPHHQRRARQPVDLHDEQAPLARWRRRAAPQAPDGAVKRALAGKGEVVEPRHGALNDAAPSPALRR